MWLGTAVVAGLVSLASYSASLKDAERLPNLGRFLESYVGDCESDQPGFDRAGCLAEALKIQERYRGKVLAIEVADPTDRLTFAGWDDQRQAYRLLLTPFFSERALGLSVGKPSRLTSEGAPVVKNVPIWVPRPKHEADFNFRRQLERGMVRLELLVKTRGVYRMRWAGHDDVRGVDVALVGVRVYASRGQDVLAEQTY